MARIDSVNDDLDDGDDDDYHNDEHHNDEHHNNEHHDDERHDDEPDAFYDCHAEVLDESLQSVASNLYGHIQDGFSHCDDDTHDIRDSGQWEHE